MPRKKHDKDYTRRVSAYAQRIRDLREDHDLSQQEIADMIHVGQRTYSDYELGNVRVPVDTLIKLAKFYDTDMNYICGISRKKNEFPDQ